MPVAAGVSRWSQRALCAAIALALSLMCVVLAVTASTAPMSGLTDMNDVPGMSVMAGIGEATSAVAAEAGPAMASMCESACVTEVTDMCSLAAGLIVITLLALLLATRRDTFLGLLARVRTPTSTLRHRGLPPPWTVLSLSSLCVLRV